MQEYLVEGPYRVRPLHRYLDMSADPIEVLRNRQNDSRLGPIVREALKFLRGAEFVFHQSPRRGQSSLSVARMYSIRMKRIMKPGIVGLEESIRSLEQREITVCLSVVETEKGLISVWLEKDSAKLIAVVVMKFGSE
jgi:hypothetical protein